MVIEIESSNALSILASFKKWGEPFIMGQIGIEYPDKLPFGTIYNLNGQPFYLVRYASDEEMIELCKTRGPTSYNYKYYVIVSTD